MSIDERIARIRAAMIAAGDLVPTSEQAAQDWRDFDNWHDAPVFTREETNRWNL